MAITWWERLIHIIVLTTALYCLIFSSSNKAVGILLFGYILSLIRRSQAAPKKDSISATTELNGDY